MQNDSLMDHDTIETKRKEGDTLADFRAMISEANDKATNDTPSKNFMGNEMLNSNTIYKSK
jgi:hypothetical protein